MEKILKEKNFDNNEPNNYIIIPTSIIKTTPNDIELGEKIRKIYHHSQNDKINDIYNKD